MEWHQLGASLFAAFMAGSGFWAYMQKRLDKQSNTTRLLMGLAYDKITFLGLKYIERGWISESEYDDFYKYLYKPYVDFGGNGVAEKIMNEVARLPFSTESSLSQIIEAKMKKEI